MHTLSLALSLVRTQQGRPVPAWTTASYKAYLLDALGRHAEKRSGPTYTGPERGHKVLHCVIPGHCRPRQPRDSPRIGTVACKAANLPGGNERGCGSQTTARLPPRTRHNDALASGRQEAAMLEPSGRVAHSMGFSLPLCSVEH